MSEFLEYLECWLQITIYYYYAFLKHERSNNKKGNRLCFYVLMNGINDTELLVQLVASFVIGYDIDVINLNEINYIG